MMTLEARLQRLEDRDAIHQLFVDYGRYLDTGDLDRYASLFTEDGEVIFGPIGRATGRDQIRELMGKVLGGRVGSVFHIISSPTVTLNGDEATSIVMWTVIQRDAEGRPHLGGVGRHEDRLARVNGAWKIAQRRGFIDLPQRTEPSGEQPAT